MTLNNEFSFNIKKLESVFCHYIKQICTHMNMLLYKLLIKINHKKSFEKDQFLKKIPRVGVGHIRWKKSFL